MFLRDPIKQYGDFRQYPYPQRRRVPRTIELPVAFSGTATGEFSVSLIHIKGPPSDPPTPGFAEALWSEFLRELVDILRDALTALREVVARPRSRGLPSVAGAR